MAAKAGLVIESREITERFLEDYSRTQGDLIVEAYYGGLQKMAEAHGMGAHSEAAGFQKPSVDALRALGANEISMSEFWSRLDDGYIHQLSHDQLASHDGIRTAASAAHTYGRRIVQAESFTYLNRMNFSTPLYELKDLADRAFCQGLNRIVLCYLTHQAEGERAAPGYAWPYVGASFNVNATWWEWSKAWIDYLNRCHVLLQSGHSVADVCYFQGEWVPSYVPARWGMDPSIPYGFDCDVISAEVLTGPAEVRDGTLVVPGGAGYRYLVLNQAGRWRMPAILKNPNEKTRLDRWPDTAGGKPLAISPTTLERIGEMVEEGITLVGPPPERAIGLSGYPKSDSKIRGLAAHLWGKNPKPSGMRNVGKGRVTWGRSLQEIFRADGLAPDVEYLEDGPTSKLPLPAFTASRIPDPCGFDWIHRQLGDTAIYFVANLRNAPAGADFTFRQRGLLPELWDPLTGGRRELREFSVLPDGRISVPLRFARRQSWFIVFRKPVGETRTRDDTDSRSKATANFPSEKRLTKLRGKWNVRFDISRGGPAEVIFDDLKDWRLAGDRGIRFYSGKACYRKEFSLSREALELDERERILLDLGRVEIMARVWLNGVTLGTLWTPPWRVDITETLVPGKNLLEIEVVNLWRNRLIGDRDRPSEERITRTNVTVKPCEELFPSGLLGPVSLLKTRPTPVVLGNPSTVRE